MKAWVVFYQNKYPGGRVVASESQIDVFCKEGHHCVSLAKNGAGQWQDNSEEYGLKHRHDLAPIPKDARPKKVVAGKIGKDELHDERVELAEEFEADGKILSCEELKKNGYDFDEKQRVIARPAK